MNKALRAAGFKPKFGKRHGRITKSPDEKYIARKTLQNLRRRLQRALRGMGVEVLKCYLYAGTKPPLYCALNKDDFITAYWHGFDLFIVCTTKAKVKKKERALRKIHGRTRKIKVLGY